MVVAFDQEQDGVMGRLRSGRSGGWLFALRRLGGGRSRWLSRLLGAESPGRGRAKNGGRAKKKPCQRGLSHADPPEQAGYPREGRQTIRTKGMCARQAGGLARHPRRRKSEKYLTRRTKGEILLACFEVGYVSSSFLHGSDLWYPTPPRSTIHSNSLSC